MDTCMEVEAISIGAQTLASWCHRHGLSTDTSDLPARAWPRSNTAQQSCGLPTGKQIPLGDLLIDLLRVPMASGAFPEAPSRMRRQALTQGVQRP